MGLPALEFFKGAEVGVGVAQTRHKTDGDLVAFQVVQECAAISVVLHGPASGVHHKAGLVALGVDFPQFLDADAEALRVTAFVQVVLGDQLLAQVAACAFGKHGVLAQQFHAELEVVGGLAFLADAQVARGHAAHRAVFVVQHLSRREAGEDFHAQGFGLLGQPLGDSAQAHDVVAVVVCKGGQQRVGHAKARLLAQEDVGIVGDGLVQRGALGLPVGDQLGQGLGVHDGARENVRAGLRAFFQHDHGHILAVFSSQLLEANGCRQTGRATAHDHHVVLHGFAGTVLGKNFFVCHERLVGRLIMV